MTLEGPRITNEDSGFTINKTLAWAMAASIVGCVFWFGTITAGSDGRITVLQERQVEDRELIRENQLQINALRATNARVDQRLLNIEQSQARQEAATNEILRYLRNPDKKSVPSP